MNTIPSLLQRTLKLLSIGTPKIINFPFVSDEKLLFLGLPIFKHIIMRLYSTLIVGYLKIMNFPFATLEYITVENQS